MNSVKANKNLFYRNTKKKKKIKIYFKKKKKKKKKFKLKNIHKGDGIGGRVIFIE